jgi:hypothetical protein
MYTDLRFVEGSLIDLLLKRLGDLCLVENTVLAEEQPVFESKFSERECKDAVKGEEAKSVIVKCTWNMGTYSFFHGKRGRSSQRAKRFTKSVYAVLVAIREYVSWNPPEECPKSWLNL